MFVRSFKWLGHDPRIVVTYQLVHNVVYSGHKWSGNQLPCTCRPSCGFLVVFVLTAAVGLCTLMACVSVLWPWQRLSEYYTELIEKCSHESFAYDVSEFVCIILSSACMTLDDDNRVRLEALPGPSGALNDYINASYIDGYNTPRKFIATQGRYGEWSAALPTRMY